MQIFYHEIMTGDIILKISCLYLLTTIDIDMFLQSLAMTSSPLSTVSTISTLLNTTNSGFLFQTTGETRFVSIKLHFVLAAVTCQSQLN